MRTFDPSIIVAGIMTLSIFRLTVFLLVDLVIFDGTIPIMFNGSILRLGCMRIVQTR